MRLLIIGSRSISDFDISPYVPADTELIISGGASGIDTVAEAYADSHRLSKLILRPQYAKYGRAAPIRRNEIMVDAGALTIVYSFCDIATFTIG